MRVDRRSPKDTRLSLARGVRSCGRGGHIHDTLRRSEVVARGAVVQVQSRQQNTAQLTWQQVCFVDHGRGPPKPRETASGAPAWPRAYGR